MPIQPWKHCRPGYDAGSDAVTGTKAITTKLRYVTRVVASTVNAGAPGVNYALVTGKARSTPSATFDAYVWKPTATGNCTLIAATAAVTVDWIVEGTPGLP